MDDSITYGQGNEIISLLEKLLRELKAINANVDQIDGKIPFPEVMEGFE